MFPELTSVEEVDFKVIEKQAYDTIQAVPKWDKIKRFDHGETHTDIYSTTIDGEYWISRRTELNEDLTKKYEAKFNKYLIGDTPIDVETNHTTYEREYIKDLFDYNIKPRDDTSYLIKTYYKLPFPMKKRNFHNIVHIQKGDPYSAVISLSIDPLIMGTDTAYVVGNYASIEFIERKEGRLVWTMATKSNPNGFIPFFVTKPNLPKAIVDDVPSFLAFCDKH